MPRTFQLKTFRSRLTAPRALLAVIVLATLLTAVALPAEEVTADDAVRRDQLVDVKLKAKGITNTRVLEAVRVIPRRAFLPEFVRDRAYDDIPLPLGGGQFDPAPSLVAAIAQELNPDVTESVLVVGVGSGWMCAVLSRLGNELAVCDVSQTPLFKAMAVFEELKLTNIQARLRDGYFGWEMNRLFDYIVVNGSINHVPEPLVASLRVGGKMILPLGHPAGVQNLVVITRTETGVDLKSLGEVIFPALKGKALDQSEKNEYPLPHAVPRDFNLTRFYPAPRTR
jgi:protein-L-isoaspartate(D-aspartate) O-methyltransferase